LAFALPVNFIIECTSVVKLFCPIAKGPTKWAVVDLHN
jgi:hypothetical protein